MRQSAFATSERALRRLGEISLFDLRALVLSFQGSGVLCARFSCGPDVQFSRTRSGHPYVLVLCLLSGLIGHFIRIGSRKNDQD